MSSTLLRAFRHPLVIASILLLLINDHLLKAYTPSWLTGKLSDFAGLFFFPLLLGALLQALPPFRRIALPAAFGLTGLVFTGLKTIPAVNGAVTALLGVQIVRDPSDLLALVMILPAWRLAKLPSRPAQRPGRLAYAMLALGSLAALATAPAPPIVSVQRLVIFDNELYTKSMSPYYGPAGITQEAIYSKDAGQSWSPVNPIPQIVDESLKQTSSLPVTACLPDKPKVCYRVDGSAKIEASQNGGDTWETVWQIPPARVEYIMRQPLLFGSMAERPDLHIYDLVTAPLGGKWLPVAAMGNQGVIALIDGEWQRLPVGQNGYRTAEPTPVKDAFFGGIGKVLTEFLIAMACGLLAYLIISIYGWALSGSHVLEGVPAPRPIFITLRFLGLWLLAEGILYFLGQVFNNPLDIIFYLPGLIGLVVFPLVWVIVIAFSWDRTAKAAASSEVIQAANIAFLASLAVFLLPALALLSWTWAWIPFYSLALGTAVAAGFAVLAAGVICIRRALR